MKSLLFIVTLSLFMSGCVASQILDDQLANASDRELLKVRKKNALVVDGEISKVQSSWGEPSVKSDDQKQVWFYDNGDSDLFVFHKNGKVIAWEFSKPEPKPVFDWSDAFR